MLFLYLREIRNRFEANLGYDSAVHVGSILTEKKTRGRNLVQQSPEFVRENIAFMCENMPLAVWGGITVRV